ncbi:hypothetical protein EVAR_100624_1 [Eumeta japonica]|uniref:Uncharacterized protein n=1 Tax=Eumeta variegata TaxID=151549 RepID=A0A4C1ZT08_EUMVA|nr:hypothetical protein EVAR_100624_1 [Eumeta japonica]
MKSVSNTKAIFKRPRRTQPQITFGLKSLNFKLFSPFQRWLRPASDVIEPYTWSFEAGGLSLRAATACITHKSGLQTAEAFVNRVMLNGAIVCSQSGIEDVCRRNINLSRKKRNSDICSYKKELKGTIQPEEALFMIITQMERPMKRREVTRY